MLAGLASRKKRRLVVALWVAIAASACGGPDFDVFSVALGEASPTWSPDGKRIAFQRDEEGEANQLYVADLDGTDIEKITHENLDNATPAWSPDGRRIAFSRLAEYGYDLFTVRDDGSGLRRITRLEGAAGQPAWSPDGKYLAFVDGPFGEPSLGGALHVVRADGKGLRRLAKGFEARHPAWSPDGRLIGFDDGRNAYYGVWLIDATGGKARRLVREASDPTWSPDGKRIAFSRGLSGIFVARRDGSGGRRLPITMPPGPGPEGLEWSPDGERIAFAKGGVIYIARVDGGGTRPLTTRE